MPYYPISTRKAKTTRPSKNSTKTHSRECVAQPAKVQNYSKESIRAVTLKLMALMKAKRECQGSLSE